MAKAHSKIRLTLSRLWIGLLAGSLLGLISPIIGIFLGLQVNAHLGTLFAAPLILITLITGIPFGEFSPALQIVSLLLPVIIGAILGALVQQLFTKQIPPNNN